MRPSLLDQTRLGYETLSVRDPQYEPTNVGDQDREMISGVSIYKSLFDTGTSSSGSWIRPYRRHGEVDER